MGRKSRRRWTPALLVLAVLALAVGTVWLRLFIVGTTYNIAQTNRKIGEVREALEKEKLKLGRQRSPRRLAELARRRVGLRPPEAGQVVHLGMDPIEATRRPGTEGRE